MNISGGRSLSLFEVQEAAGIVASASDDEFNMIFGSVINENLTDEIIVTVIATGFTEKTGGESLKEWTFEKEPFQITARMRSKSSRKTGNNQKKTSISQRFSGGGKKPAYGSINKKPLQGKGLLFQ